MLYRMVYRTWGAEVSLRKQSLPVKIFSVFKRCAADYKAYQMSGFIFLKRQKKFMSVIALRKQGLHPKSYISFDGA